jgi:predicted dienelactone hydrolase
MQYSLWFYLKILLIPCILTIGNYYLNSQAIIFQAINFPKLHEQLNKQSNNHTTNVRLNKQSDQIEENHQKDQPADQSAIPSLPPINIQQPSELIAQLPDLWQRKWEIDAAVLERLLSSQMGENLLASLGNLIVANTGENGQDALKNALLTAANDPAGLTVENIIQKLSQAKININLIVSTLWFREFELLRQNTINVSQFIENLAKAETSKKTLNTWQNSPDLREPGNYQWQPFFYTFFDEKRQRHILANIYLPDLPNNQTIPVIVISHGLADSVKTWEHLAEHLVTHGYAVIALEHSGSNTEQLTQIINGYDTELTTAEEFINRPLDVSFILNQLTDPTTDYEFDQISQKYQVDWQKLNLNNVGIIGHSFGGYTALALAGVKLDFDQLKNDCKNNNIALNPALLLQCLALNLSADDYNKFNQSNQLADNRIKSVFLINPVTSAIFNRKDWGRLNIPIFMVTSGGDTVAPSLIESITPFTRLTSPNRYLMTIRQGQHFFADSTPLYTVFEGEKIAEININYQAIARGYVNAFSVAFFDQYLENQGLTVNPYLTANYAEYISQSPLQLSLIRSLTKADLSNRLKN